MDNEQQTRLEAYERRRQISRARDRAVQELGATHELVLALDRELREATEAVETVRKVRRG